MSFLGKLTRAQWWLLWENALTGRIAPFYPSDFSVKFLPTMKTPVFSRVGLLGSIAAILLLATVSPPLQAQDYTLPAGSDSFSIPDLGGWSITSSGTAETVRVGYGRIRANTGSTTPSGIAIFQFRNSAGVLISEAGVPAIEPVLEGRIFAEVDGPVNTGLALANPNDETAIISFYFTDTHGTNFGMDSFELGALQQTAKFLNEPPFNGESPVLGTFTFESSVPIAVIALRGFTNEADEFLVTTLPVAPLSSASEETVYFPPLRSGGRMGDSGHSREPNGFNDHGNDRVPWTRQ